jgi:hypothetical protein
MITVLISRSSLREERLMTLKYPAVLTNKEWQKHKGLFAKSKPTGIGEKLVALEKVVSGSPFLKIAPAPMGMETKDPLVFERKLAALTKTLTQYAAKIDAAAVDVDKAVTAARPTFAKDKSVTKYLDTLTISIKGLRADIKPGQGEFKEFIDEVTKAYKAHMKSGFAFSAFQDGATRGEKKWSEAMALIKKVESAGNVAAIHAAWGTDGPARSITTFCKLWDQYAPEFPELTKKVYAGKAMNDFADLPWMKDTANETNNNATTKVQDLMNRGMAEDRAVTKMTMEYSSSMIKSHDVVKHIGAVYKVLAKAAG